MDPNQRRTRTPPPSVQPSRCKQRAAARLIACLQVRWRELCAPARRPKSLRYPLQDHDCLRRKKQVSTIVQDLDLRIFLRPVESSSSMLFASLVPFLRRRVSKRSEAQTVARARSRVGVLAMSNSVEDGIIVGLDGDEIVVWKPRTVFLIALKKPDHQRHLVVGAVGLPTSLPNH